MTLRQNIDHVIEIGYNYVHARLQILQLFALQNFEL
jgi:hypothetical protein